MALNEIRAHLQAQPLNANKTYHLILPANGQDVITIPLCTPEITHTLMAHTSWRTVTCVDCLNTLLELIECDTHAQAKDLIRPRVRGISAEMKARGKEQMRKALASPVRMGLDKREARPVESVQEPTDAQIEARYLEQQGLSSFDDIPNNVLGAEIDTFIQALVKLAVITPTGDLNDFTINEIRARIKVLQKGDDHDDPKSGEKQ